MKVQFDSADLERLYYDPADTSQPAEIAKQYRKVVGLIRAAVDERDLYAFKGRRYKKLKGNRKHQRSLRLNDQWRLIVEIQGSGDSKEMVIIGIEDYH